jgi:hypothetical protein
MDTQTPVPTLVSGYKSVYLIIGEKMGLSFSVKPEGGQAGNTLIVGLRVRAQAMSSSSSIQVLKDVYPGLPWVEKDASHASFLISTPIVWGMASPYGAWRRMEECKTIETLSQWVIDRATEAGATINVDAGVVGEWLRNFLIDHIPDMKEMWYAPQIVVGEKALRKIIRGKPPEYLTEEEKALAAAQAAKDQQQDEDSEGEEAD